MNSNHHTGIDSTILASFLFFDSYLCVALEQAWQSNVQNYDAACIVLTTHGLYRWHVTNGTIVIKKPTDTRPHDRNKKKTSTKIQP